MQATPESAVPGPQASSGSAGGRLKASSGGLRLFLVGDLFIHSGECYPNGRIRGGSCRNIKEGNFGNFSVMGRSDTEPNRPW